MEENCQPHGSCSSPSYWAACNKRTLAGDLSPEVADKEAATNDTMHTAAPRRSHRERRWCAGERR